MKHCYRFYTGVCMEYCESLRYIVVGASNSNYAPSSCYIYTVYIFFFHHQNCHSTSVSDLAADPPQQLALICTCPPPGSGPWLHYLLPSSLQKRQCYQPLLPADVPPLGCPVGLNLFHTKLGKKHFLYRHGFVHKGIIIMLKQERAFPKLLPQHC